MRRLMVSSFDDAFADYGFRMYRSFARFNPDVPMAFCDHGNMSRLADLEPLGVKILPKPCAMPVVRLNYLDMLLHPYVEKLEWDKLLWVDADTLVLRPLDPIWRPHVDFVGHPDRDTHGLRLTCDIDMETHRCGKGYHFARFATGIWLTRSRDLLKDCWQRVKQREYGPRDSDLITEVVNTGGYSFMQLDGNLWNFGRDTVPLAHYDGEHISYRADGRTYLPYAVAYSRVPVGGKDTRLSSAAVDKFYKERVCGS